LAGSIVKVWSWLVFEINCVYDNTILGFDAISSANLSLADNSALPGHFVALPEQHFISAQDHIGSRLDFNRYEAKI